MPKKGMLVSVVLGAAAVFVVLALFVEVANQRSEPRKMAAPIQSFEQLGLMVLSAELKPCEGKVLVGGVIGLPARTDAWAGNRKTWGR